MTGREMFPTYGGWPFANPINCPFTINLNSPQAEGLVAWWPLGPGQYGMVRDVLGRWHLTANNGPTLKGSAWGLCTLFNDGANQYLDVAHAVVTGYPFTLTGWFNTDDDTRNNVILSLADVDSTEYYALGANGGAVGDPVDAWAFDGAASHEAKTTTAFIAGQWHFGTGLFESATARYALIDAGSKGSNVDNVTVANLDHTAVGVTADLTPFGYMSGLLRDLRIYSRIPSDGEISAMYRNPWDLFSPLVPYILAKAPAAPTGNPWYAYAQE